MNEIGRVTLPDTKTQRAIGPSRSTPRFLLANIPRVADFENVFPGVDPDKPLVNINSLWYAVRRDAKLSRSVAFTTCATRSHR